MTVIIETDNFNQLVKNIEELTKEVKELKMKTICENYLTIEETCKAIKVSKRTLQNYRDKGLLAFSKIENKLFFKFSDLEEFMQRHKYIAFAK